MRTDWECLFHDEKDRLIWNSFACASVLFFFKCTRRRGGWRGRIQEAREAAVSSSAAGAAAVGRQTTNCPSQIGHATKGRRAWTEQAAEGAGPGRGHACTGTAGPLWGAVATRARSFGAGAGPGAGVGETGRSRREVGWGRVVGEGRMVVGSRRAGTGSRNGVTSRQPSSAL
jgi:hypothetical protein